MGGKRDRFGIRDGLEATVSVPEGEEHLVAGLEPVATGTPTKPQPADVAFEVREVQGKGFGVFVPTQKAPLTIQNVTWFPSGEEAQKGIDALKASFGWAWTPPRYEMKEEDQEVDGPYGPETQTVSVQGDLLEEGYWTNRYHLIFDPSSLAELGLTGGTQ